MCKKCFFRKPSVNDLGVIVQSKSPLTGGISWRGAVVRGYLFKENCREGKSPWRTCPGVNFMGGAIVLGVIVQEKLSRGNCAGDKSPWDCPGSNFLGTNCPGVSCPVANFSVVIVRGTKVWENFRGNCRGVTALIPRTLLTRFDIIFRGSRSQMFYKI